MTTANNIIPFTKEMKKDDVSSIEVLIKLLQEKDEALEASQKKLELAKKEIRLLQRSPKKVEIITVEQSLPSVREQNLAEEVEKLKRQNLLLISKQFSISEEDFKALEKMKKYQQAIDKMGRGEKF